MAPQVVVKTLKHNGQVEWKKCISIDVPCDVEVLGIVQVERLSDEGQVQRERQTNQQRKVPCAAGR